MSSVASSEASAVDEDANEKLEYDLWEGQFSLSEGDTAASGSMTNSVSSTVTLTASGAAADLVVMDPKAVKNAKNQQRV